MNRNSTHLLSFRDIKIDSIDLIGDAFGYEYFFADMLVASGFLEKNPSEECLEKLLRLAGCRT